eukprot:TRINITY_DN1569_c0_g1_i1.p1 TRINITY_DN1569_c0_g1~~TRINITY_DN1569_c0_g1_i1.p1  ORF type:complete len:1720 (-),score=404.86 TRINITY_DN1569_c0_g1_i1:52-5211(-)
MNPVNSSTSSNLMNPSNANAQYSFGFNPNNQFGQISNDQSQPQHQTTPQQQQMVYKMTPQQYQMMMWQRQMMMMQANPVLAQQMQMNGQMPMGMINNMNQMSSTSNNTLSQDSMKSTNEMQQQTPTYDNFPSQTGTSSIQSSFPNMIKRVTSDNNLDNQIAGNDGQNENPFQIKPPPPPDSHLNSGINPLADNQMSIQSKVGHPPTFSVNTMFNQGNVVPSMGLQSAPPLKQGPLLNAHDSSPNMIGHRESSNINAQNIHSPPNVALNMSQTQSSNIAHPSPMIQNSADNISKQASMINPTFMGSAYPYGQPSNLLNPSTSTQSLISNTSPVISNKSPVNPPQLPPEQKNSQTQPQPMGMVPGMRQGYQMLNFPGAGMTPEQYSSLSRSNAHISNPAEQNTSSVPFNMSTTKISTPSQANISTSPGLISKQHGMQSMQPGPGSQIQLGQPLQPGIPRIPMQMMPGMQSVMQTNEARAGGMPPNMANVPQNVMPQMMPQMIPNSMMMHYPMVPGSIPMSMMKSGMLPPGMYPMRVAPGPGRPGIQMMPGTPINPNRMGVRMPTSYMQAKSSIPSRNIQSERRKRAVEPESPPSTYTEHIGGNTDDSDEEYIAPILKNPSAPKRVRSRRPRSDQMMAEIDYDELIPLESENESKELDITPPPKQVEIERILEDDLFPKEIFTYHLNVQKGDDENMKQVKLLLQSLVHETIMELNPDEIGVPIEVENDYIQRFHVKWLGYSHFHNTWDTLESLRLFPGFKRVLRYLKRKEKEQAELLTKSDEELEDIIAMREKEVALFPLYKQVERIIHARERDGKEEVLVLWKELNYDECTWEAIDCQAEGFESELRAYNDRKREKKSGKLSMSMDEKQDHLQKWNRGFETQPWFIRDNVLRDYQLQGINFLTTTWLRDLSVILADEMGLGKTIQTLCFIATLYHIFNITGPFLIIIPLSTLHNWLREAKKWTPELNVVAYYGNKFSRQIIRKYEFFQKDTTHVQSKFHILLTTYEIVNSDIDELMRIKWSLLCVDEAHKLKSKTSTFHNNCLKLNVNTKLLITGTPYQNSIKEFWNLLNFANPSVFHSFEQFEDTYNEAKKAQQLKKFHEQWKLQLFVFRRTKKQVEKSLPPKHEQILRIPMTKSQKKWYATILARDYDTLIAGSDNACLTNIFIDLKKICNHNFLIGVEKGRNFEKNDVPENLDSILKNSGKMRILDQLLEKLKAEGHRVLVFCQMVRMLKILEVYMKLKGYRCQKLHGQISSELRKRAIDQFNAVDSQDFIFLCSTKAGGIGINLATADTVIIFDSDWNPQNDLQAESRAHRIGQESAVSVYRFVTAHSVEEEVLQRQRLKMLDEQLLVQTVGKGMGRTSRKFHTDDLTRILKFGSQSLFIDDNENVSEEDFSLNSILQKAEIQEAESTGSENDFLDSFATADLESAKHRDPKISNEEFWSKIIPAESRNKNFDGTKRQRNLNNKKIRRRKNVSQTGNYQALFKAIHRYPSIHRIDDILKAAQWIGDVQSLTDAVNGVLSVIQNSFDCDPLDLPRDKRNVSYGEEIIPKPANLFINSIRFEALNNYVQSRGFDKYEITLPKEINISFPKSKAWTNWNNECDEELVNAVWVHGFDWLAIRDDHNLPFRTNIMELTAAVRVKRIRKLLEELYVYIKDPIQYTKLLSKRKPQQKKKERTRLADGSDTDMKMEPEEFEEDDMEDDMEADDELTEQELSDVYD